ncbi:hypothetical protein CGCVW01_v004404 [Colletotrichum viniferum]|nr:hypothetical protein CGCVW01_v004404 [Colletotrichum viniferum]
MVERCLQEGDYVMLVRPPSLTWLRTQPMKVSVWDRPCIGIKPEAFTGFHSDFDGDEARCYPLSSEGSLWEASNWVVPELSKFSEGRKMMRDLGLSPDTDMPEDHACFVEFTTLSSKQLKDGDCGLYFGEQSRNPKVPPESVQAAREELTFCMFEQLCYAKVKAASSSWCANVDGTLMCLISPQRVTGVGVTSVMGAYNPQILEKVASSQRHRVCTEALRSVMGFYGCYYSEPEVHDLAYVFS